MYEFETTTPLTVDVHLRSGTAVFMAEERDTTTVEVSPFDLSEAARTAAANTRVELHGDTLIVQAPDSGGWMWRRSGPIRVVARVPLDSLLRLRTASADAAVTGRWREGSLHSASGDLRVDEVTGDLAATTASGNVLLGGVGGAARLHSASGDVTVGSVGGEASLHSASGNLRIGDAANSVTARTASGDIELGRARRGTLRMQTASGDVLVAIAPGTGVYLDVSTVSGATRSELSPGEAPTGGQPDLHFHARTVSGDVTVLRAQKPADQVSSA